jgi:hypothetical protein
MKTRERIAWSLGIFSGMALALSYIAVLAFAFVESGALYVVDGFPEPFASVFAVSLFLGFLLFLCVGCASLMYWCLVFWNCILQRGDRRYIDACYKVWDEMPVEEFMKECRKASSSGKMSKKLIMRFDAMRDWAGPRMAISKVKEAK